MGRNAAVRSGYKYSLMSDIGLIPMPETAVHGSQLGSCHGMLEERCQQKEPTDAISYGDVYAFGAGFGHF